MEEIEIANNLLEECGIDLKVTSLRECTPTVFIVILEQIIQSRLPDIQRTPKTISENLNNLKILIENLKNYGISSEQVTVKNYETNPTRTKKCIILALKKIFQFIFDENDSPQPPLVDNNDMDDRVYLQTRQKFENLYRDLEVSQRIKDLEDQNEFLKQPQESHKSEILDVHIHGGDIERGEREFERRLRSLQTQRKARMRRLIEDSETSNDEESYDRNLSNLKRKIRKLERKHESLFVHDLKRKRRRSFDEDSNSYDLYIGNEKVREKKIRRNLLDISRRNSVIPKVPQKRLKKKRKKKILKGKSKKRMKKGISKYQRKYRRYLKQYAFGQPKHMYKTCVRNLSRDHKIEYLKAKRRREELYNTYKSMEVERMSKEEQLVRNMYKRMIHLEKSQLREERRKDKVLKRNMEKKHSRNVSNLIGNYGAQLKVLKGMTKEMDRGRRYSKRNRKIAMDLFLREMIEDQQKDVRRMQSKIISKYDYKDNQLRKRLQKKYSRIISQ